MIIYLISTHGSFLRAKLCFHMNFNVEMLIVIVLNNIKDKMNSLIIY